jgi:hypothetical protein
MSLEGYTGPTSGRITIGGDKPTEVKRFYDKPLTRDERNAVAWFEELSPHEQLREVRRLKWNLDQAESDRDVFKRTARRLDTEILHLRAELAARRPDGFEIPRAADEILKLAKAWGWKTVKAWIQAETYGVPDLDWYRFEIAIGRDGIIFQLSWSVPVDGHGRGSMIRRGLAKYPRRDWHDAPSLTKIKRIIKGAEDV